MLKKLVVFGVLGLFLLLAAIVFFNKNKAHPKGISIDKEKYPVTGIDLSHYSGSVDFEKLKEEENPDFIFLRVSAGTDKKDGNFEKYYKDAIENKFIVGFYHYYRFNEDPIEQANFFIKHIKSKKQSLPIVLDIEEWGNDTKSKVRAQIVKELKKFIEHVETEMDSELMIYTNESGYNTYVKNKIKNKDIWICSFKRRKKIEGDWLFWQHSHKGKYKAVEGWVDINTFNGDKDEWEEYLENRR